MAFEKKIWVNVPDPSNPPSVPEGQDALARFDADNMNRIEEGIKDAVTHIADATVHNQTRSGGGAIGVNATTDTYGGSVGYRAESKNGGAVGSGSITENGGSVGNNARTANGGAIGYDTRTSDGVAAGASAKTLDNSGNPIDAIQLGTGTNNTPKTFQAYGYRIMSADGTIPAERMPSKAPSGHGLGELTQFYSSDFIDMIQHGGGFYVVGDATDSPTGKSHWFNLIQLSKEYTEGENNETGVQIVADSLNGGGDLWFRNVFVGTTYNWKEILHSGNLSRYTAKTELVSYKGTGLYGKENACQATFSFVPRIVIMLNAIENIADFKDSIMVLDELTTEYADNCGFHVNSGYNITGRTKGKKSEDGKTIYWYMTGNESYNSSSYFYNSAGSTYYLLAI